MSIRKDKEGQWHVELCIKNQRVHRRLPTGSAKSDAEHLEARLLLSIKDEGRTYVTGDPALTDVMGLYVEHAKSLRSESTAVHHAVRIGPWCKGFMASQARKVADKFAADCRESYKPATINRSLGALKKALKLAWEMDMTPEDYGAKIKRLAENNERHDWVSPEQAARIAAFASENVQAMIWIALLTGCRRGEILKIQRDDIKRDHIVIRALNTKSVKTRIVPIIPAIRPWLKKIPIQLKAEGVKSGWKRAAEKAGLSHLHFHDLRHGCATTLVQLGVDLYTIQQILGHSTPRMTQRYAKMSLDVKKSAMSKLAAAVKKVA